jgi:hypothetical protein
MIASLTGLHATSLPVAALVWSLQTELMVLFHACSIPLTYHTGFKIPYSKDKRDFNAFLILMCEKEQTPETQLF